HRHEPLLLLLLGAEQVERHGAEPDRRLQRDRRRRVHPRQLFDGDAEREEVGTRSTVRLGEREPEQAQVAHLLQDRGRQLAARICFLGLRRDDLVRKRPDGPAELLGLRREVEIHGHSYPWLTGGWSWEQVTATLPSSILTSSLDVHLANGRLPSSITGLSPAGRPTSEAGTKRS